MYVPLHVHTCVGSIGDSILQIEDYAAKAKEMGLPAIAITDHGSLAAIQSFYKACREVGIKPIFGCEVYVTSNRLDKTSMSKEYNHLVLLAATNEGYVNLLKIVNDANINGFYYKPRTDYEFLRQHGKGIIALSGCLAGEVPQAIINGDLALAEQIVDKYRAIFDDYYLEIQPGDFEEQRLANSAIVKLAFKKDVKLVATNDIHYLSDSDAFVHDRLVKINRKLPHDAPWVYPDKCYWFMSADQLANALVLAGISPMVAKKAIANTTKIADRCNVAIEDRIHMPVYSNKIDQSYLLAKMCFDRLFEMQPLLGNISKYAERLNYELDVIDKLGFSGYFLIVHDLVNYAKKNKIAVGPGRGSAVGSLVSYLLGISVADPLKYNLLFERFLSQHRKSLPDVDLDFCADRRDEMFEYIINRYGADHCAMVSTYHIRKSRAAIRDAGRVLGIDLDIVDKIAKLVPQVYYDDEGEKVTELSIEEALEVVPELRKYQKQYPELFDLASKIANLPSAQSVHAAGAIISPVALDNKIPLVRSKKDFINATSYSLGDVEKAGFVKFDFLSLATLTVVDKTQRDVGYEFDYHTNTYDDPNVWQLISSTRTTGLFQISSKTYKSRLPLICPKTIDELAACLALIRGPCIAGGYDKLYIDIVNGRAKPDYIHPIYRYVTQNTKGIVLYQEQIMQLAVELGFSLDEGYDLIKAIAKKKQDKIASFKDRFYSYAANKGMDKVAADKIWSIIENAGKYSFNRSHAVSYALLCYASAYLKTYYPMHYLSNLLTNIYSHDSTKRQQEIKEVIDECRQLNIAILPLGINSSSWDFAAAENGIRIGFCAVKGLGLKAYEEIARHRPYKSFDDFYDKVNKTICNKKVVSVLIAARAFDELNEQWRDLFARFCSLRGEEIYNEITVGKDRIKLGDGMRKILLSGLLPTT